MKGLFSFSLIFLAVGLLSSAGIVLAKEPATYDGMVLPREFIPLCAPQNSLRLPFYGSDSNAIKLKDIKPEGTTVKPGDVVAEFFFESEEAKEVLEERDNKLQAVHEDLMLGLKKNISDLSAQLDRARVRASVAALDLLRKPTLAKIKAVTMDLDAKIQELERKAIQHKFEAARENYGRVQAIRDGNARLWQSYFTIFQQSKQRYKVIASQTGFLFYPQVDKLKRKIQIGDEVNSGVHFLSIVTSETVELRFFLPEKDLPRVACGDQIIIMMDGNQFPAKIVDIGFFPQRTGDVYSDYHRPDAWEKCFIVRADVLGKLKLGSNNLVRVKLQK